MANGAGGRGQQLALLFNHFVQLVLGRRLRQSCQQALQAHDVGHRRRHLDLRHRAIDVAALDQAKHLGGP